jgi:hypothetical protein
MVDHDLAGELVALGVGDDREVELAGGDAVDQLGGERLVEPQADLGVLRVERADRERDQRRVGGRGRADVQPAAAFRSAG